MTDREQARVNLAEREAVKPHEASASLSGKVAFADSQLRFRGAAILSSSRAAHAHKITDTADEDKHAFI
jgi:hypothetical protein